jgi:DNA-binding response OmpR family regulator
VAGTPPVVLVVDDDQTIRDVVVRYLEHNGYAVLHAADGESARAAIVASPPDLVILDLMLPVLDGIDLCRWVRDASDAPQLPIIMLTARAEESDRIVGLELGADDYVVKPFSPRELVQRVKAVLRRTRPVPTPQVEQLTYGALHLDATAREVWRDGRLLALTATEFDLLWCLAAHPRVVFSREQLLARVWRYQAGTDVGTSTVTVHVRRLREKLEPDPSAPRYITTIWGVGYRFEPDAALVSA